MYEVWELPDTKLFDADNHDDALHQLDAECRRRHAQVVANGEGALEVTYRFEIRNQTTGTGTDWLTYSPDTTRPYESVLTADILSGERP